MAQQAHGELERTTTSKHAIVLQGQLCAVLAASTGAAASLLAASGVNAPTAQSALVYAILALIYGHLDLSELRAVPQLHRRGPLQRRT